MIVDTDSPRFKRLIARREKNFRDRLVTLEALIANVRADLDGGKAPNAAGVFYFAAGQCDTAGAELAALIHLARHLGQMKADVS